MRAADGDRPERLFVAVVPPEPVADGLDELDRPAEAGVRYTTRDQWHCTLRFLGTTASGPVVAALEGMEATAAHVVLGPRVVRLGRDAVVLPAAGLDELAATVLAATAHLGEPADQRPFAGHLTLARLRRRDTCGILGAAFEAHFEARQVVLVSSDRTPAGARYRPVASRNLQPR